MPEIYIHDDPTFDYWTANNRRMIEALLTCEFIPPTVPCEKCINSKCRVSTSNRISRFPYGYRFKCDNCPQEYNITKGSPAYDSKKPLKYWISVGYHFSMEYATKTKLAKKINWNREAVGKLFKDFQECLSLQLQSNDFMFEGPFVGKL